MKQQSKTIQKKAFIGILCRRSFQIVIIILQYA